jgi:hypothetical protein
MSTRTLTHVSSGNDGDATSSNIELLDPDVVNTKGRPRMLTIREATKQNKVYTCSHCNSNEHTIKKCPNKDKHYDLPRRKRSRSNPRNQKKSKEPYSSLKLEFELLSIFIVVHGNVDTHAWVEQRHE